MGRDKSDESIQEEKNLTGKIQHIEYELQVLEDKYLLSGMCHGSKPWHSFHRDTVISPGIVDR